MNKKAKILLVCITNNNLGDSVITDCAQFLIEKALGFKKNNYEIFKYSMFINDLTQIKFCDAVIFAGGGIIKYKYENFYRYTFDIINEAQKYNIPVYFNAVGVEDYDGNNENCLLLKDAVNKDCVKAISIRDDAQLFEKSYNTNKNIKIISVFDSAVWAKDVYKKTLSEKSGGYIGLGIAREGLFVDNGVDFVDKQFQLDYWKNTVSLLEEKGYKWKLFTNGAYSDEIFALEILDYIGHGEKLPRPLVSSELVNGINSFDAVIATRMHSNIVAYSLGIPSVGLVWNDKLKMWGEKIGHPERFILPENLTADNTVCALENAIKDGCGKASKTDKKSVLNALKDFLKTHCKKFNTNSEAIDFNNKVIETAMGGIDCKHRNLNCLWEMKKRAKCGCKLFEADIRVTPDLKAVCINGWSEKNAHLLSKTFEDGGLPYAEFKQCKYDGYFPVTTFEQLCDFLSKNREIKIILDVGKPLKALAEELFYDMVQTLQSYLIKPQSIIVRLQRKNDLELWRKQKYPCEIAYYLPQNEEEGKLSEKQQAAIKLCKKEKIKLISMRSNTYNDYIAGVLKDNSLKSIVLSYTKTDDLIEALKRGADFAGSIYYSAKYMEDLYT